MLLLMRFSRKLDGTLICAITPTNQFMKMSWSRKERDSGSLNPRKLWNNRKSFRKYFYKSNYKLKEIASENTSNVTKDPMSDIFKLSKLLSLSTNKVSLESTDWLKNLMGDWCSRNTCAFDLHSEGIGLVTPSIPWTSHADTIKHMLKSKPISLLEVVRFIPYFHNILHHFQLRGKSLAISQSFRDDEPENNGLLFYYKSLNINNEWTNYCLDWQGKNLLQFTAIKKLIWIFFIVLIYCSFLVESLVLGKT